MRSADVVGAEAAAGAAPPLGDTAPRDRRRLGVAFWLSVGWIGVVVLIAVGYVLVNFLVDVSYSFIDPRIKDVRALG